MKFTPDYLSLKRRIVLASAFLAICTGTVSGQAGANSTNLNTDFQAVTARKTIDLILPVEQ